MRRQHSFIATLGLIAALSGLPPVVVAGADDASGSPAGQQHKSQKFVLKQDQMDGVTAGRWMNRQAARWYQQAWSTYLSCTSNYCRSNYEAEMAGLEALYWSDDAGDIQCYTC